jgi:6,7-dimethyl-8-ribityllumazine synthase
MIDLFRSWDPWTEGYIDNFIKGMMLIVRYYKFCEHAYDAVLVSFQLDTGVPVIFGVLTALSEDQALEPTIRKKVCTASECKAPLLADTLHIAYRSDPRT